MMDAVFEKEDFGGGAKNTLHFVEERLLPMILNKYNIDDNIKIILGGYSLAGLFSLWCSYQTEKFNAIVAASPSVWFDNWEEYIKDNIPLTNLIYLSLGDKEEKTKNKVMRRVGDAIRTQDMLLNKQKISHTLDWNEGGHFVDSELRMAKGFSWCIESSVK
nr:alpha/beta hydrolase-fold protein [uncultured Lachnoanaerobaculum sp.]